MVPYTGVHGKHKLEWVGLKNKKKKTQNLGLDGKVEVDQRGAGKQI